MSLNKIIVRALFNNKKTCYTKVSTGKYVRNLQQLRLNSTFSDKLTSNQKASPLVFRQLFHQDSFTYSYLIGCEETKHAILIDPVIEMVDRDIQYIEELGLKLLYAINTHVHADHITGSGVLKSKVKSCQSGISKNSQAKADVFFMNDEQVAFGKQIMRCISTPGHTAGCMTYILDDHKMAFTGDALLIRGCGRTDFQQGNPMQLYDSVHENILSLPEDYKLFPGHDYKGFTSTTVKEEKDHNPRLRLSKDNFVIFMRDLNLAYPKMIDKAVPANLKCGQYSKEAFEGTADILNSIK